MKLKHERRVYIIISILLMSLVIFNAVKSCYSSKPKLKINTKLLSNIAVKETIK